MVNDYNEAFPKPFKIGQPVSDPVREAKDCEFELRKGLIF